MSSYGSPVGRSLRRRGQLLVVVSVLLGALIGVALGLAVEDTGTSSAVAALGRGAALAASPSGSQPKTSRTAGAGRRSARDDASKSRDAERVDRPDKGHGKAPKDGEDRKDKPGKSKQGKDKPDKGKDK